MLKEWTDLENEIATREAALADWEELLRNPPRPEMKMLKEGIRASEGLFGTKWLMTMEQVSEIIPRSPMEQRSESLSHFGKFYGRDAGFSYHFKNNLLREIWVVVNDSSEKDFQRVQSRLTAEFGPMPAPSPYEHGLLRSKCEFTGLLIEHRLDEDVERGTGITEWIEFCSTSNLD